MAAPGGNDRLVEAVDRLLALHAIEDDPEVGGLWCELCVDRTAEECEVAEVRAAREAMLPPKTLWVTEVPVGYLGE